MWRAGWRVGNEPVMLALHPRSRSVRRIPSQPSGVTSVRNSEDLARERRSAANSMNDGDERPMTDSPRTLGPRPQSDVSPGNRLPCSGRRQSTHGTRLSSVLLDEK